MFKVRFYNGSMNDILTKETANLLFKVNCRNDVHKLIDLAIEQGYTAAVEFCEDGE